MISHKFIENNLYRRSIISYLLYPLGLLFAAIQVIRRLIYSTIPGLSYHSPCHIISIGNIVSGGSGKTPLTIFLARFLAQKGKKVAVSHRDYAGNFEQDNKLISDFKEVYSYAEYAGDEAYLLALNLPGIPVIAGKNRKKSIDLLLQKFPDLDHIILDDSFQHLKVEHDLDLITINADSGIGNGFVLPAGILREPVKTLRKADIIILTGSNELPDYVRKYKAKVISGKYQVKGLYNMQNKALKTVDVESKKIALFSGIGNPLAFEKTVREMGLDFLHHFKFADHYHFKQADLEKLQTEAKARNIDFFMTTEKDQVKLTKLNTAGLNIVVLKIELKITDTNLLDFF